MFPYISHLLAALLLGAIIGAERQWRQRMAGLRTNALVATGAAVVDSIGQRNSYVKTWGCGGFLNETNIYSRGKSLCF